MPISYQVNTNLGGLVKVWRKCFDDLLFAFLASGAQCKSLIEWPPLKDPSLYSFLGSVIHSWSVPRIKFDWL